MTFEKWVLAYLKCLVIFTEYYRVYSGKNKEKGLNILPKCVIWGKIVD